MDQQRIDILNGLKRELAESRVQLDKVDWGQEDCQTVGRVRFRYERYLYLSLTSLQSTVGGLLDALERREV